MPLLPPELKTRICVSTPLVHVSKPLTAAQVSLACICQVPCVEAVPCLQGVVRTTLAAGAMCSR